MTVVGPERQRTRAEVIEEEYRNRQESVERKVKELAAYVLANGKPLMPKEEARRRREREGIDPRFARLGVTSEGQEELDERDDKRYRYVEGQLQDGRRVYIRLDNHALVDEVDELFTVNTAGNTLEIRIEPEKGENHILGLDALYRFNPDVSIPEEYTEDVLVMFGYAGPTSSLLDRSGPIFSVDYSPTGNRRAGTETLKMFERLVLDPTLAAVQ